MKKVFLFTLVSYSTVMAGPYVGGGVGANDVQPHFQTSDCSSLGTKATDFNVPMDYDNFFITALCGYSMPFKALTSLQALESYSIGMEVSFDFEKNIRKTNGSYSQDVVGKNLLNPAEFTFEKKANVQVLPYVSFKLMDWDFGLGVGLNYGQFGVHAVKTSSPEDFRGRQRKWLMGYEPTVFMNYHINKNLSARFSYGYSVYDAWKSKEMTHDPDTAVYVKVKPRIHTAKLSFIWRFSS